jgi:hypothetical protein
MVLHILSKIFLFHWYYVFQVGWRKGWIFFSFLFLVPSKGIFFIIIVFVGGGTLWHLQKFI